METENINKLEKIKCSFLNQIKENEKIVNEAIKKECGDYKDIISIDKIQNEILYFEMPKLVDSTETIAIKYNGRYEITIYLLLYSTMSNKSIHLFYESYNIINTVLIEIYKNALKELKIESKIFNGNENNRAKLIKNQEQYDEITYVGDYFECESLQHFIKKDINYNNYGFFKVYIDLANFQKEYAEIMKYAYIHDVSIEKYETLEELEENVQECENIIVFTNDTKSIKKIKAYKNLYLNENPFKHYKFKINLL